MSEVEAVYVLCDAAEEWAEWCDGHAEDLARHGKEGRRAAAIWREQATEIREAVQAFRPLRVRDTETDEWIEP